MSWIFIIVSLAKSGKIEKEKRNDYSEEIINIYVLINTNDNVIP